MCRFLSAAETAQNKATVESRLRPRLCTARCRPSTSGTALHVVIANEVKHRGDSLANTLEIYGYSCYSTVLRKILLKPHAMIGPITGKHDVIHKTGST